jgi:iron-sulfur cluster repair protein YtfE (RIC family)
MAQQYDACTFLDEQHIEVTRLFEQYKATHDGAGQRMICQQISNELTLHMQIEEEIFYPAFSKATGDTALVQESDREHQQTRELIGKLERDATPDSKLMQKLEAVVVDHVKDEREKMFPEARKTRGLDLMQLARELETRKTELIAAHPA